MSKTDIEWTIWCKRCGGPMATLRGIVPHSLTVDPCRTCLREAVQKGWRMGEHETLQQFGYHDDKGEP